jgi:hypothetical protein
MAVAPSSNFCMDFRYDGTAACVFAVFACKNLFQAARFYCFKRLDSTVVPSHLLFQMRASRMDFARRAVPWR